VSPHESRLQSVARVLITHALRVAPAARRPWIEAIAGELAHLHGSRTVLVWALGAVFVGYRERFAGMARFTTVIPRWLLALEMTLCLVPLTWLFVAIVDRIVQGSMPLRMGLLYGSAALLGPVGVLLALRALLGPRRALSRVMLGAAIALLAWTVLAESGLVLHMAFSNWWREYTLIALLPALGVTHLLFIDRELHGRPRPG